jgi:hypothetical protein
MRGRFCWNRSSRTRRNTEAISDYDSLDSLPRGEMARHVQNSHRIPLDDYSAYDNRSAEMIDRPPRRWSIARDPHLGNPRDARILDDYDVFDKWSGPGSGRRPLPRDYYEGDRQSSGRRPLPRDYHERDNFSLESLPRDYYEGHRQSPGRRPLSQDYDERDYDSVESRPRESLDRPQPVQRDYGIDYDQGYYDTDDYYDRSSYSSVEGWSVDRREPPPPTIHNIPKINTHNTPARGYPPREYDYPESVSRRGSDLTPQESSSIRGACTKDSDSRKSWNWKKSFSADSRSSVGPEYLHAKPSSDLPDGYLRRRDGVIISMSGSTTESKQTRERYADPPEFAAQEVVDVLKSKGYKMDEHNGILGSTSASTTSVSDRYGLNQSKDAGSTGDSIGAPPVQSVEGRNGTLKTGGVSRAKVKEGIGSVSSGQGSKDNSQGSVFRAKVKVQGDKESVGSNHSKRSGPTKGIDPFKIMNDTIPEGETKSHESTISTKEREEFAKRFETMKMEITPNLSEMKLNPAPSEIA